MFEPLACLAVALVFPALLALALWVRALAQRTRALEEQLNALGRTPRRDAREAPAEPLEAPAQPAAPPAEPAASLEAALDRVTETTRPATTPPAPEPAPRPAALRVGPEKETPASTRTRSFSFGDIDWERLLGVRGAAIVGGIFAALAAILLFKHGITNGWITPAMRVGMGALSGGALIAFGGRLRGKSFAFVPGALEGAGLVALFATLYAADERYGFLSLALSLPGMAAVTALGCYLALKHGSRITITLALVGGFAAPLILQQDPEARFTRFGYVLLLDLGLLFVAQRRRWGWVGLLALVGTTLFEGLWVFGQSGRAHEGFTLIVLALFGALFAAAGALIVPADRRRWFPATASGILFPFVFVFYFAQTIGEREELWPLALVLALLVAAGCLVGRLQDYRSLASGATAAALLVSGVWALSRPPTVENAWELALVGFGLVLVPHGFLEWERRDAARRQFLGSAALLASIGWSVLHVITCARGYSLAFAAPVTGLVLASALLVRQACLEGRGRFVLLAAALASAGQVVHFALRNPHRDWNAAWIALVVLALAALLVGVLGRRAAALHRAAWHGAGILLAPFLAVLSVGTLETEAGPLFPGIAGLVFVGCLAGIALRLRVEGWLLATLLASLAADAGWIEWDGAANPGGQALLFTRLAFLGLFAAWTSTRVGWGRLAFGCAAAAVLLGELTTVPLWVERSGESLEFVAHVALALVAAGGAALYLRARDSGSGCRHVVGAVWLGGAAAFLFARGLATALDREVAVLTLAFTGVLLAALARGLRGLEPGAGEPDRTGSLRIAAVSVGAMGILLVVHAATPGHYAHTEARLFNTVSLVHALAALSAVGSVLLARGDSAVEVAGRGRGALGARLQVGIPGLAAIVAVFLWINLAILNHYTEAERLRFGLERLPARDLVTSLSWGVYAVVLLATGTRLRVGALRWASLALFLITIGKVFLRDLGHLEGLYRVGSLAGLAISLLGVSVFYQRFVFRRGDTEGDDPGENAPGEPGEPGEPGAD